MAAEAICCFAPQAETRQITRTAATPQIERITGPFTGPRGGTLARF